MANPDPSPKTRFKPGQSGNPGGKSEGQRAAEIEAARISAEIRLKMVSSLQEKLEAGLDAADIIAGDVLKLFKDSEDRAHGTPKSTVAGDPENPLAMALKVTRKIVKPD